MPTAIDSIDTILIIGATSGIGEACARRFHTLGKHVIATGRREERLAKLRELQGLETYVMDNAELDTLPVHVETIIKRFPTIDTVWVNSGTQTVSDFTSAPTSTSSEKAIEQQIVVNVTAPTILARHFIPHLLRLTPRRTNFIVTSSALGFVPFGIFADYCATKSFVHSLMVGIRQQLNGTSVSVIEFVPPYVATELVSEEHRAAVPVKPMPLEDFTTETFEILAAVDVKELKEVAPGPARPRVDAWRGSIGSILENMKVGG